MKSIQAQAASAIRAELKNAFPTVKFSVKSESFSGGNSVNIHWYDGPLTKEVDAIVGKYQYGHFNGMEDIYEYSNKNDDIPQAKYVQTSRKITQETQLFIAAELGIQPDEINSYNQHYREYNSALIWREFSQRSFVDVAPVEVPVEDLSIFQATAQAESVEVNTPDTGVEMYAKSALAALSQISIFPADIELAKKHLKSIVEEYGKTEPELNWFTISLNRIGDNFIGTCQGIDIADACRRLHQTLQQKGYQTEKTGEVDTVWFWGYSLSDASSLEMLNPRPAIEGMLKRFDYFHLMPVQTLKF